MDDINTGNNWAGGPAPQPNGAMGQPIGQPVEQMSGQPVIDQPAPGQPIEQPMMSQPVLDQSLGQPVMTPPIEQSVSQPMMGQNAMPSLTDQLTLDTSGAKHTKKLLLTVFFLLIGALVVGIVILAVAFLNRDKGGKIVSCSKQQTAFGVTLESEVKLYIADGVITSGKVIETVDLKNAGSTIKNNEKEIVDKIKSESEDQCGENCTFDYTYVEGDSLKIVEEYNAKGVQNNLFFYTGYSNASAQEIADQVQKTIEEDDSRMVCGQY